MAPTAEKAQQEPQLPWSLGGLTMPLSTQLTSVGRSACMKEMGSELRGAAL